MTENRILRIRAALEGAGLKWFFDAADAEDRTRGLSDEFTQAEDFYNKRYQTSLVLLDKVESEPDRYLPFLQSIGLPFSKELRVIILRLLEGKEILELKFHYRKHGKPKLVVQLNEDYPEEPIEAPFAWDALLLPQLGYLVSVNRLDLAGIRPWDLPKDS